MTDVTMGQEQELAGLSAADEQVLRELAERARAGGLRLTGEGGLLGRLTKMVVEGTLEGVPAGLQVGAGLPPPSAQMTSTQQPLAVGVESNAQSATVNSAANPNTGAPHAAAAPHPTACPTDGR